MRNFAGLNLDTDPLNQPEGTLRDVRNMVYSRITGSLATERGTLHIDDLPVGSQVCGQVPLPDDTVLLFVKRSSDDALYIVGQTIELVYAAQLGFSLDHSIQAQARVNPLGQTIVYFTDALNPVRLVNLSTITLSTPIKELNLFTIVDTPVVLSVATKMYGGSLPVGFYNVAVAYMRQDGSTTDFSAVSTGNYVGKYEQNKWSEAGEQTTCSFEVNLSNLEFQTFPRVRVALISRQDGVLSPVTYRDYPISSTTLTFLIERAFDTEMALEEVVVDKAWYSSAKAIAQEDGFLYLANLKSNPDLGYQKYANAIRVFPQTELRTRPLNPFGLTDFGQVLDFSLDKGFQRDGVYALYIYFMLKNGQRSKAYHIPGRAPINVASVQPWGTTTVPAAPAVVVGGPSVGSFAVIDSFSTLTEASGAVKITANGALLTLDTYEAPQFEITLDYLYSAPFPVAHGDGLNIIASRIVNAINDPNYGTFLNFLAVIDGVDNTKVNITALSGGQDNNGIYYEINQVYGRPSTIGQTWTAFAGGGSTLLQMTVGADVSTLEVGGSAVDVATQIQQHFNNRPSILNKWIVSRSSHIVYLTRNSNSGGPVDNGITFSTNYPADITSTNSAGGSVSLNGPVGTFKVVPSSGQIVDVTNVLYGDTGNQVALKIKAALDGLVFNSFYPFTSVVVGNQLTVTNNLWFGGVSGMGFNLTGSAYTGITGITFGGGVVGFSDTQDSFGSDLGIFKQYQLNNDVDSSTGMGYWQNINEFYPDNEDSDVWTVVMGEGQNTFGTLRNTNVRHHRIPINDLQTTDNQKAVLRLRVENVLIPDEIKDQVTGWGIMFAERGQDHLVSQGWVYPVVNNGIFKDNPQLASTGGTLSLQNGNGQVIPSYGHVFHSPTIGQAQLDGGYVHPVGKARGKYASWLFNMDQILWAPDTFQKITNHKFLPAGSDLETFSFFGIESARRESRHVIVTAQNLPYERSYTNLTTTEGFIANIKRIISDISPNYASQILVDTGTFVTDLSLTQAVVLQGDTFIHQYAMRMGTANSDPELATLGKASVIQMWLESRVALEQREEGANDEETFYPATSVGNMQTLDVNDTTFHDNFIRFQTDASQGGDIKPALPYDYRNKVIENLPNTIIRSLQQNENSLQDSYRNFLASDRKTSAPHRGPIMRLDVMYSRLLIHHERSILVTRGREQLVVEDATAFIGSGDIFNAPPQEIVSTQQGHGGLQDVDAAVMTPLGYFFVDRRQAKCFMLVMKDSQFALQEVSLQGLRLFMEKNLITSDLICGYDNRTRRVMLTSKGQWTLSYYPELNAWGSFHDLNPQWMCSTVSDLLVGQDEHVWKTGQGESLQFMGVRYPAHIDAIFPYPQTAFLHAFEMVTRVEDVNETNIPSVTFDSFRVTNTHQDTGTINLTPYNLNYNLSTGNLRQVGRSWKVNQLRDQTTMLGGIYQRRLADKWHRLRLTFNPQADLTLYLLELQAIVAQVLR